MLKLVVGPILIPLLYAALITPNGLAQNLMQGITGGPVQLLPSDAFILEAGEKKKDLPCTVTQVKPLLGFDLRFHAGYTISIPLKEIAGDGQTLTVVFSVTPDSAKNAPAYFYQKFNVPQIDADAGGNTLLDGDFEIGEGNYHLSWLMRDKQERICSSNWDLNANLTGREQGVKVTMPANGIESSDNEYFKAEPPVMRDTSGPLKVKVLVNYSPQDSAASSMRAVDTSALVSILRSIAREPRIVRFSVVAFNMNSQRVVYRHDNLEQINFPDLGKALSGLKLGMVDFQKLSDPHSEADFLAHLVQEELAGSPADAVIFAGPKVMLDQGLAPEDLKGIAAINYPVFYMNYILDPKETPWRDAIGNVVRKLRGVEYTISRPAELWNAWTDIMSRLAKLKLTPGTATSSH